MVTTASTVDPARTDPVARRPARERLLGAADELFYEQGIHTVGIDKIIERAGVAKASLYATFGSKEELVRAYLEGRQEARRARIESHLARHKHPRERILSVLVLLAIGLWVFGGHWVEATTAAAAG